MKMEFNGSEVDVHPAKVKEMEAKGVNIAEIKAEIAQERRNRKLSPALQAKKDQLDKDQQKLKAKLDQLQTKQ